MSEWQPTSRWARIRWGLEVVALAAASLWAIGELLNGHYNPAAELSIKSMERKKVGSQDKLIVSANFKVARARLVLTGSSVAVRESEWADGKCRQAEELSAQGFFPPGDGTDFACALNVPARGCIDVAITLKGRRAIPLGLWRLWPESQWTTRTLSCADDGGAAPTGKQ